MTDLYVTVSDDIGHTVISPRGKIAYDTLAALRTALEKPLAGAEPKIIVDLSGVTLCDSSGLQILIDSQRQASAANGWLRLAGPQPLVRRVLEITQLTQLLPIHDSVAEAIAG